MTDVAIERDPSVEDASVVVARMQTDPERGLTGEEAARRLAEYGPNEIASAKPVPRWLKFLEQFRDPLVYLLLAAIVISLLAWLVEGRAGLPF
ncbi:MAG: cation-transporting P-type ATPase, partial [Actinomycetes bacterium]